MRWGLDLVEIPPLRTSSNGWYYDFDGSTLGRGSEGLQAADKVIKERRLAVLAAHDFKNPDEVWPQHLVGYHPGLVAWCDDPVFGQVGIALNPSDGDNHRLTLDVHPLLHELVNQTPFTSRDTTHIAGSPHLIAPRLWEHARELFPSILERVKTPEVELKWSKGELEQEDGSLTKAVDDKSFFRTMSPDALDEAASKRIQALISLFNVLGHNNVRVQTQYVQNPTGYGSMMVTTGIEVVVRDPEHEETHRIKIGATGQASITCGYRESEQKYLEYQKRQLAGWMQGELGDDAEFEEITFD